VHRALSPETIQHLDAYALRRYAVVALQLDTRLWSVLRGGQLDIPQNREGTHLVVVVEVSGIIAMNSAN
jgi:hypothetical protein